MDWAFYAMAIKSATHVTNTVLLSLVLLPLSQRCILF